MKYHLTEEQMIYLTDELKYDCSNATKEWVVYPEPQEDWSYPYKIKWSSMWILKDVIPNKFKTAIQMHKLYCYTLADLVYIVLEKTDDYFAIVKTKSGYQCCYDGAMCEQKELIDLLFSILCYKIKTETI